MGEGHRQGGVARPPLPLGGQALRTLRGRPFHPWEGRVQGWQNPGGRKPLCFFDAHTVWTPEGASESSLSRQTYLAPLIVPNKSISPGPSHLPLGCRLPAPIPGSCQLWVTQCAPPPQALGRGLACLLRAPSPSPPPSQGILCQASPPTPRPAVPHSAMASVQQPCHWIPSQSFVIRGTWPWRCKGLQHQAHSPALARTQPFLNLYPLGPPRLVLGSKGILVSVPLGPTGWKN